MSDFMGVGEGLRRLAGLLSQSENRTAQELHRSLYQLHLAVGTRLDDVPADRLLDGFTVLCEDPDIRDNEPHKHTKLMLIRNSLESILTERDIPRPGETNLDSTYWLWRQIVLCCQHQQQHTTGEIRLLWRSSEKAWAQGRNVLDRARRAEIPLPQEEDVED